MNYIVFDTETTNGFDNPFLYDLGWAILNEDFEVIEARSFVNADIFLDKEMMANAYFADKIPQYWRDIKSGKRELKTFYNILKAFREDVKNYEVEWVIAHNARFDYKSCSDTQRWLTKSKYRRFFPYGVKVACSLDMATQVLSQNEDYISFCRENDFMRSKNYPRLTAEILYRYLTNDVNFEESHTGLEDVMIEKVIAKYCLDHGAILRPYWER